MGWGGVIPNFYKSLFLCHIWHLFLPKMSSKFTVKVPSLWSWGVGGWFHKFRSMVPNFPRFFFWGLPFMMNSDESAKRRQGVQFVSDKSVLSVHMWWGCELWASCILKCAVSQYFLQLCSVTLWHCDTVTDALSPRIWLSLIARGWSAHKFQVWIESAPGTTKRKPALFIFT